MLDLTPDEQKFLHRILLQRIKKKEKDGASLARREGQPEEEFYDFMERRAHSMRFMRGLADKLAP